MNNLRNLWTFVENFTAGIIGHLAGRNGSRRALRSIVIDVAVPEQGDCWFEAVTRASQRYADVLEQEPDFPVWNYRVVRDTWEEVLRYELLTVLLRRKLAQ